MTELFSNRDVWTGLVLFWSTMMAFFFLKDTHKLLDLISLAFFILYWIGLLVFGQWIMAKLFVTLLMLSIAIVRLLVTKKKTKSVS